MFYFGGSLELGSHFVDPVCIRRFETGLASPGFIPAGNPCSHPVEQRLSNGKVFHFNYEI